MLKLQLVANKIIKMASKNFLIVILFTTEGMSQKIGWAHLDGETMLVDAPVKTDQANQHLLVILVVLKTLSYIRLERII